MYVNGRQVTIEKEMPLSGLLLKEGYDPMKVAVEKNGNIIPRKSFETETLSDSDKIEVVAFVGGG